jgi:hypothetical protein
MSENGNNIKVPLSIIFSTASRLPNLLVKKLPTYESNNLSVLVPG